MAKDACNICIKEKWLKYIYGVKHYIINQSINKTCPYHDRNSTFQKVSAIIGNFDKSMEKQNV